MRFKTREAKITDEAGNEITIRALTAGERMEMSKIAGGEDKTRVPFYIFSTCCTSHPMTEDEVRKEVPSDLLDRACGTIMEWARPQLEKKDSTKPSSSSADLPTS